MNYRRGLQRICLVLGIAWLAFVLYGTPRERLMFWTRSSDIEGIASRFGGRTVDASAEERILEAFPYPDLGIRGSKLFWLIEVGILPPTVLYLILFYVIPWIYRGFHSGTLSRGSA